MSLMDETEELINITNANYLRAVQKQLVSNVEISIDEEKKYGDELVSEFKKKYEFVSSGKEINKLNVILENLVSRIANPRGVNYEIHYVNDGTFNVFTLGGHIIFFKGMYDFCKSDDEIAQFLMKLLTMNLDIKSVLQKIICKTEYSN